MSKDTRSITLQNIILVQAKSRLEQNRMRQSTLFMKADFEHAEVITSQRSMLLYFLVSLSLSCLSMKIETNEIKNAIEVIAGS